jgi:anti-anti-sigma factor
MELDLDRLFFLDSAGLALVLEVERAVRQRRGGRLNVLRPSPNVANVIEQVGRGLLPL